MRNDPGERFRLTRRGGRRLSILCFILVVPLFLFSSAARSQVSSQADLAVSVDNERGYVSPAQNFVYTITVRNNGPDNVVGAIVMDVFPAALTRVTWGANPVGRATSAQGSGTGNLADTVNLPVGDTVVYTVSATVDQAASATIINTVAVQVPNGMIELVPANNTATDSAPVVYQEITRVRAVYANGLPSPNAFAFPGETPPDNGATAFNGHVGDWSAAVNAGRDQPRFTLKMSSFGQPFAQYKSQCIDVDGIVNDAMDALFYPVSQNSNAAFRYLDTLYTSSALKAGAVAEIERRLSNYLLYDAEVDPNDGKRSDEECALEEARKVTVALQAEPDNRDLRSLLLDIYYYRTLGRQIAAKDKVAAAYQINFSSVVSPDSAFGTPINAEITAYQEAAALLATVLDPYRDLLLNDFGVNVGEIDPFYGGSVPFGYYLFQQEVPYRSVYAPTYANYDPDTGAVSGTPQTPPSREAPVLYVSPSSFHADGSGLVDGANSFTFTISNLGGGKRGRETSIGRRSFGRTEHQMRCWLFCNLARTGPRTRTGLPRYPARFRCLPRRRQTRHP